eukprot:79715-Pleurochrysis_carterae.AAC.2
MVRESPFFLLLCMNDSMHTVNVLLNQDAESAGGLLEKPHTFFCHRTYDAKTKKIGILATPAVAPAEFPSSPIAPAAAEREQEPVVARPVPSFTASVTGAPVQSACSASSTSNACPEPSVTAGAAAQTATAEPVAFGAASFPASSVRGDGECKKKRQRKGSLQDFALLQEEVTQLSICSTLCPNQRR